MHTYIHTITHSNIRTYMHEYIYTCIHTYMNTYIHTHIHADDDGTQVHSAQYRMAKTHRMPYLHRSFSAKEPYD